MPPTSTPPPGELRILVAEDDPVNRRLFGLYLDRLGHPAQIVSTGDEAVRAAASRRYDVILMDLQLPDVDGREATRRIRASGPEGGGPWVIAVTAEDLPDVRVSCREAGMDGFLAKPFDLPQLERALRRGDTPRGSPTEGGDTPCVDFAELQTLCARLGVGGPPAVRRLIDTYVQSSGETARRLAEHARARERVELRADAHRLKSASAAVGARRLEDLCRRLEGDLGSEVGDAGWPAWLVTAQRILGELDSVHLALRGWAAPGDTHG